MSNKKQIIIAMVLFIALLLSLWTTSEALKDSTLFGQYYSALLIFNISSLCALLILIIVKFIELFKQIKKKEVGSRITTRLVLLFTTLSITPVTIVYLFSLSFLHDGIDNWFNLNIEQSLDNSLELSQLALDVRIREFLNYTKQGSEELHNLPITSITVDIDQVRNKIGADEIAIMTSQGNIIASSSIDTNSIVPDMPDDNILLQLQQGSDYAGLDPTKDGKLAIRIVVPIPTADIAHDKYVLQALFPLTKRIHELTDSVQSSFIQYQKLDYLREQLKINFIIILTLVLLFSIISAILGAFYFSQKLMEPIKNLVEGTKSVAMGNYQKKLPVLTHDELGFLVASFNAMTVKIGQAQDHALINQQEAEAQQRYLEALIAQLSSGVLVFNSDHQLQKNNISAEEILQTDIVSLIGLSNKKIIEQNPKLQPVFDCIDNHIKEKTNNWREQITIRNKDDEQILTVSGVLLFGVQNEQTGYVVVLDEITALVQIERDATWQEIAKRLAHEIKNPLTPIQLAAERLRDKYSTTTDEKNMINRMTNTIIQQVNVMKDMINNFYDYANPSPFKPIVINLKILIIETIDLFSNMENVKKISAEFDDELPLITGNAIKIRQVFNNLLQNAIDANAQGNGDLIEVSVKKITYNDHDLIEINISDNGVGINENIKHDIFTPYVTNKPKGIGLGLSIVKKIIDEHHGEIIIKNHAERQGAIATIRLPISTYHNISKIA